MQYHEQDQHEAYAIESISDIQQNIKLKKWRRQRFQAQKKSIKILQVNSSINFASPTNQTSVNNYQFQTYKKTISNVSRISVDSYHSYYDNIQIQQSTSVGNSQYLVKPQIMNNVSSFNAELVCNSNIRQEDSFEDQLSNRRSLLKQTLQDLPKFSENQRYKKQRTNNVRKSHNQSLMEKSSQQPQNFKMFMSTQKQIYSKYKGNNGFVQLKKQNTKSKEINSNVSSIEMQSHQTGQDSLEHGIIHNSALKDKNKYALRQYVINNNQNSREELFKIYEQQNNLGDKYKNINDAIRRIYFNKPFNVLSYEEALLCQELQRNEDRTKSLETQFQVATSLTHYNSTLFQRVSKQDRSDSYQVLANQSVLSAATKRKTFQNLKDLKLDLTTKIFNNKDISKGLSNSKRQKNKKQIISQVPYNQRSRVTLIENHSKKGGLVTQESNISLKQDPQKVNSLENLHKVYMVKLNQPQLVLVKDNINTSLNEHKKKVHHSLHELSERGGQSQSIGQKKKLSLNQNENSLSHYDLQKEQFQHQISPTKTVKHHNNRYRLRNLSKIQKAQQEPYLQQISEEQIQQAGQIKAHSIKPLAQVQIYVKNNNTHFRFPSFNQKNFSEQTNNLQNSFEKNDQELKRYFKKKKQIENQVNNVLTGNLRQSQKLIIDNNTTLPQVSAVTSMISNSGNLPTLNNQQKQTLSQGKRNMRNNQRVNALNTYLQGPYNQFQPLPVIEKLQLKSSITKPTNTISNSYTQSKDQLQFNNTIKQCHQ